MKTMMKFMPLFLLFVLNSLQAQNCDYKTNEVDKFTKERILETPMQTIVNVATLGREYAVHLSLLSVNDDQFVQVQMDWRTSKFIIKRFWKNKSKVYFNLADGETVVLAYGGTDYSEKSTHKRRTNKGKTTGYTNSLKSKFTLTPEAVEKLSTAAVTQIRIELEEDATYDFDVLESGKSPLLGIPSKGVRMKKTKPQQYFIEKLPCLESALITVKK